MLMFPTASPSLGAGRGWPLNRVWLYRAATRARSAWASSAKSWVRIASCATPNLVCLSHRLFSASKSGLRKPVEGGVEFGFPFSQDILDALLPEQGQPEAKHADPVTFGG